MTAAAVAVETRRSVQGFVIGAGSSAHPVAVAVDLFRADEAFPWFYVRARLRMRSQMDQGGRVDVGGGSRNEKVRRWWND